MKNRAFVRNLFLLLLSVALIGGIAYLLIRSPRVTSTDRCEAVTVEVKTETGGEPLFLTGDRITDELARRGIQLRGKRLDSIDLRKIERTLLSMPIYKRAEAFIAPSSSSVQIRLTEKHPLYIVQEASGKSYYVTQGKGTITVNPTFAAYLPIVSGAVDLKMATGPVYDLMAALREDPYFTDYFGQVYVDETDGIVLIPRIGTTRVIMGRESNWSEKLRKWRIFAESVLPKRGMNAFSYVNLDYGTQIIARSRYAPEGETFDEEGEVVAAPAQQSLRLQLRRSLPTRRGPARRQRKPLRTSPRISLQASRATRRRPIRKSRRRTPRRILRSPLLSKPPPPRNPISPPRRANLTSHRRNERS